MANLKWDLLPKETRLQIREAMMEEMMRILGDEDPSLEAEIVRKKASQAVNQSIWRERQNNKAATAVLD